MSSLEIRRHDVCLDPAGRAWDRWISQFPSASAFHTSAWARVLHETYGYRALYLAAHASGARPESIDSTETGSDRDAPVGLLPLMQVDSWLTGRRGIALPFTDECEPLAESSDAAHQLHRAALAEGRYRRWRYLEIRGGVKPDWAPSASTSFHGHVLDLTLSETALFGRIDSSGRRAIRKAEQNHVTIDVAHSSQSVRELYGLLRLTRRRHGVPPQPISFFRGIHQHLFSRSEPSARTGTVAPQGRIYLARHQSRTIAGALFLELNDTVLFKFGASDERYQHLRPNNLIMWHAIKDYAARGVRRLDFGRTSVGNEGLRKFKLSWGAKERTVDYYRYDFRMGASVRADDHSSGRHTAFFRHLPLSFSSLVGALLYRHVA